MPRDAAAEALGMGLSTLKRVCSGLGIKRWPHRKLASVDQLHEYLKSSTKKENDAQREELLVLIESERAAIMADPNHEVDPRVEQERVLRYKRTYAARMAGRGSGGGDSQLEDDCGYDTEVDEGNVESCDEDEVGTSQAEQPGQGPVDAAGELETTEGGKEADEDAPDFQPPPPTAVQRELRALRAAARQRIKEEVAESAALRALGVIMGLDGSSAACGASADTLAAHAHMQHTALQCALQLHTAAASHVSPDQEEPPHTRCGPSPVISSGTTLTAAVALLGHTTACSTRHDPQGRLGTAPGPTPSAALSARHTSGTTTAWPQPPAPAGAETDASGEHAQPLSRGTGAGWPGSLGSSRHVGRGSRQPADAGGLTQAERQLLAATEQVAICGYPFDRCSGADASAPIDHLMPPRRSATTLGEGLFASGVLQPGSGRRLPLATSMSCDGEALGTQSAAGCTGEGRASQRLTLPTLLESTGMTMGTVPTQMQERAQATPRQHTSQAPGPYLDDGVSDGPEVRDRAAAAGGPPWHAAPGSAREPPARAEPEPIPWLLNPVDSRPAAQAAAQVAGRLTGGPDTAAFAYQCLADGQPSRTGSRGGAPCSAGSHGSYSFLPPPSSGHSTLTAASSCHGGCTGQGSSLPPELNSLVTAAAAAARARTAVVAMAAQYAATSQAAHLLALQQSLIAHAGMATNAPCLPGWGPSHLTSAGPDSEGLTGAFTDSLPGQVSRDQHLPAWPPPLAATALTHDGVLRSMSGGFSAPGGSARGTGTSPWTAVQPMAIPRRASAWDPAGLSWRPPPAPAPLAAPLAAAGPVPSESTARDGGRAGSHHSTGSAPANVAGGCLDRADVGRNGEPGAPRVVGPSSWGPGGGAPRGPSAPRPSPARSGSYHVAAAASAAASAAAAAAAAASAAAVAAEHPRHHHHRTHHHQHHHTHHHHHPVQPASSSPPQPPPHPGRPASRADGPAHTSGPPAVLAPPSAPPGTAAVRPGWVPVGASASPTAPPAPPSLMWGHNGASRMFGDGPTLPVTVHLSPAVTLAATMGGRAGVTSPRGAGSQPPPAAATALATAAWVTGGTSIWGSMLDSLPPVAGATGGADMDLGTADMAGPAPNLWGATDVDMDGPGLGNPGLRTGGAAGTASVFPSVLALAPGSDDLPGWGPGARGAAGTVGGVDGANSALEDIWDDLLLLDLPQSM